MAGVKISALPAVAAALTTDIFPVVQAGVTSQETILQVRTLFGFDAATALLAMSKGGTNANLTAALGAIPYSTASAFALLAPGTAGQLFSSGGAGAPVWTTATFPVAAGASGNVLVSDGTNWSSSSVTGVTALGAQAQALNMNTHLINNVVDPVSLQDAATKNYVDKTALNGTSVYAASAATLGTVTQSGAGVGATLTNAGVQATFALDGVNPPVGSNVLIKDTATGMTSANEGIYTVTDAGSGATNWVLTRATSYDTPTEINNTGLIVIQNGSTLVGTAWYNASTIVTVDTTAFSYSEFGNIVFPVTLAHGGTSAALTASNGGIFYSTATTGAILSGTATANQMLQSGASAAPAWSTSTWPATTTVSQLLYSSSTNTVTGLATANNGVLVTSNTGVPSILSGPGSTGLALLSNAGAAPSWSARPPFTKIVEQFFSVSGTYTPTSGMQYCVVEVVGGGGGGGAVGNTGATTGAAGGGGGGGGYARVAYPAATIGVSQTVTIGAAGAGGTVSGAGGTGGTTSLGALVSAAGGVGGGGSAPGAGFVVNLGGAGGGSSYGDISISGAAGMTGICIAGGQPVPAQGGFSYFGAPGVGVVNAAANPGTGFGAGGCGIALGGGAAAGNGGAGTAGCMLITEYCL